MITVAAPFYLRKLRELGRRHVVIAVLAFVCLLVPTVGSFDPAPPWPINLFPYLVLAYMLVGGSWLFILRRSEPGVLAAIEADLERALEASAHAAALAPSAGIVTTRAVTGRGGPSRGRRDPRVSARRAAYRRFRS